jgi:hypothetical protein
MWTIEQESFLRENANLLSSEDIGHHLSKTGKAVRHKAERLGISLSGGFRRCYKAYSLNEQFFAELTPITAYWLGVIWADGTITQNGIRIEVIASDKSWLELFTEDIKSSAPIRHNEERNSVRLGIYSRLFLQNLLGYGLAIGNRTKMSLLPLGIPDNLIPHFVRGVFDGDGCFTMYGEHGAIVTVTNTEAMCNWILNKTRQFLNVYGGVYQRKTCNVSDWKMGGRRQVQRFAEWIYNDASRYLQRKRNKFIENGFKCETRK